MKKLLLNTILLGAAAMAAYAQTMPLKSLAPANDAFNAPAKEEAQKFNIQFCGSDVGGWTGYYPEQCQSVTAYIYIPAEQATKMAGNTITGLTLSVVAGTTADITAKGYVFISEDLTQDPVSKVNMTYKNAYFLDGYAQQAQLPRSKQYVIKENTPFYFGYTVNFGDNNDFIMLGFDKLLANDDYSGTVVLDNNGTQSVSQGKEILKGEDGLYHNLFLYAMSEGTPLETDQFKVGTFSIGSWTTPTFDKKHMMPMKVEIENTGTTDITKVDYTYWFASDSNERTATATVNIPAGTKGVAELPIDYPVGRSKVSVRLEKVNETALKLLGGADFFYLGETGYPAKFIVEKLTGTKCGYCPRGIYAFQYMEEKYPEDFVGIEMMNYNTSEPYYCLSYGPISNRPSGAPGCVINRAPNYNGININYAILEDAYKLWKGQRSNGSVELEVTCDDQINVTSHTTFAADDDHSYRIAYVICENELPGVQTNNYVGSEDPIIGDWGKKGSRVSWIYNNVAREVQDALGYYDSTIHSPRAGSTYDCSLSFDKRCLYASDPSKAYVCALLIDATTGELLTAAKCGLTEGSNSGVTQLGTDSGAAEYYNLQGLRVSTPSAGQLYIKVQNGKATKVKF